MGKKSYVGIVDKIKVLKSLPNMLVRFTLHTNSEDINCLVSRKELATLILFLDDGKYELATYGHYNSRNQFIIENLA